MESDLYPITTARARRGERPCLLCGQPLTNPTYEAHLVAGGAALAPIEPTGTAYNDDRGWHDIGTSCARTLPARYVRRRRSVGS